MNPTKSPFNKFTKAKLDTINKRTIIGSKLNQWKNTDSVINWFNKLKITSKTRFIKFDITKFYPSITKTTLINSLKFAEKFTPITDDDQNLILHSCKSTIFYKNQTWEKINTPNLFNVSMGSYNGAEVCDMVGLFMLNEIKKTNIFQNDEFGIYRDDGLAVIQSKSPRTAENTAKTLHRIFNKWGFKITIETGLIQTDFLDIELNLPNKTYIPFRKPNSDILYVSKQSNHPNQILKQLPITINERLNNLSSNQESFNRIKHNYQSALKSANHKFNLAYQNQNKTTKKQRKRKIIYFNPPFSLTVATKIGKEFLNLVKKHFDENHPYHKIFNRNTLKISYSCMENFKTKILKHNNKILNNLNPKIQEKTCNCKKEKCPLDNNCLARNIIYKATITTDNTTKFYVGSTSTSFKNRYNNHKASFNNKTKKHNTELSNYIWKLKETDTNYNLRWEILCRTKTKPKDNKTCHLCSLEKYEIEKIKKESSLNKRKERQQPCLHNQSIYFKRTKTKQIIT